MNKLDGPARYSGDFITALSGRNPARNLHSDVLLHLGLAIVSGRYPEGAILPPDSELLEHFRVSRTVLREALKTLAAKGLIQARARIGTRILPRSRWNLFDPDVLAWHFELGPSVEFLGSLAEVRIGIEVEAAALAAERRNQDQAEALRDWVNRMDRATSAEEFVRCDLEFHRTVAAASGNPFMASISALVEMALAASFFFSAPVDEPEIRTRVVAMHGDIAQAIIDQNPEAARTAMRETISQGFERAAGRMTAQGAQRGAAE